MTFWADRTPTAQETGHHLHSRPNTVETALASLALAAAILPDARLTGVEIVRFESLMDKLNRACGRKED